MTNLLPVYHLNIITLFDQNCFKKSRKYHEKLNGIKKH